MKSHIWFCFTQKFSLLRCLALVLLFIVFLLLSPSFRIPLPWSTAVIVKHNINEFNKLLTGPCNCTRDSVYKFPAHTRQQRFSSSCSDARTWYQTRQNVISFSLYFPKEENAEKTTKLKRYYLKGLLANHRRMHKYYPGYSLRLYTNINVESDPDYCVLFCEKKDLFWCNIQATPSHGDLSGMDYRTWRFLPLGDPTVYIFLSRDLDSLISSREAAVVADWLSYTDKSISVMRDRPAHDVPILGGMWQGDNLHLGREVAGALREEIIRVSQRPKGLNEKGTDQVILKKVVYYPRQQDIVAYDSYLCSKYASIEERPFPTRREGDFVGNVVDFSERSVSTNKSEEEFRTMGNFNQIECPSECRPDYRKEWQYC